MLGVVGVAGDRDLVAAHVDRDGERVLDEPEQLVAVAQQVHHEVVPRNEDLELGRRRGGHVPRRASAGGPRAAPVRYAEVVVARRPSSSSRAPSSSGRAAEHGREHPDVVAADGEHPAVEVLALELDRGGVPGQHLGVGVVELVELAPGRW